MKRFLCVLICLLLLAGCEKNSKEVENEILGFYGFRTDVKTVVNGINISAVAEYTETDKLILTLTSPDSVKGMTIKIKDGECEIEYQSLSFFVSVSSMPFDSLCVSLNGCAENFKTADYVNNYYSYSMDGYIYHLYVDKETNNFYKIMVNDNEIITFENFRFLNGHTD